MSFALVEEGERGRGGKNSHRPPWIRLDCHALTSILEEYSQPRQIMNNIHGKIVIFPVQIVIVLGDPEVTANIYCKSRNLPNTDTQNYSTDLR